MKHLIIVKYNDKVDSNKKIELINEIQNLFNQTLEIKGIYEINLRPNIIDRSNRFDLIIEIVMDKSALEEYDASKAHQIWKEKYSNLLLSKTIIDVE